MASTRTSIPQPWPSPLGPSYGLAGSPDMRPKCVSEPAEHLREDRGPRRSSRPSSSFGFMLVVDYRPVEPAALRAEGRVADRLPDDLERLGVLLLLLGRHRRGLLGHRRGRASRRGAGPGRRGQDGGEGSWSIGGSGLRGRRVMTMTDVVADDNGRSPRQAAKPRRRTASPIQPRPSSRPSRSIHPGSGLQPRLAAECRPPADHPEGPRDREVGESRTRATPVGSGSRRSPPRAPSIAGAVRRRQRTSRAGG